MKVLHLASFTGNIGDNANHSGFRRWFAQVLGRPVAWTDLEIREYYWRERRFDESFVDLVSGFDLLVIGGGNYFELWVERSHTGTSIDIPPDVFARIRVPIFFNALGCDASQGTSPTTIARFNEFMGVLAASTRYLVTVRNDGAGAVIRQYLPPEIAAKVATIPDGGFFLEYDAPPVPTVAPGRRRIGINLACDMPEIRFREFGGADGYGKFCDEFAAMVEALARDVPDADFVLFPHIHSDLKFNSDLIGRLSDRLRRTRISTGPYLTGMQGARTVFGLYSRCELIIGMRFHANVCAFGMGVPAIGLYNYPQIHFLYEELACSEQCVDVRAPGFSAELQKRIREALDNPEAQRKRTAEVMGRVERSRKQFEPVLRGWLEVNALGPTS